MTVSVGFYRKIHEWIIDELSNEIKFRPFQVNGNPYKSKVFLVGLHPEPLTYFGHEDAKIYADSLVDARRFEQLNGTELITASREYKGCLNFARWMEEHMAEKVVLSYVNCLLADDYKLFKQLKKENHFLYISGQKLFEEVVLEFGPELMIIEGTKAFDEFRTVYSERLINKHDQFDSASVQELEKLGVVAEFPYGERNIKILACRNMSYFGRQGTSFGELKEEIQQILKESKGNES